MHKETSTPPAKLKNVGLLVSWSLVSLWFIWFYIEKTNILGPDTKKPQENQKNQKKQ